MAQDGGTRGGTFHGDMDRAAQNVRAGLRHAVSIVLVVIVCPGVAGRTKERRAQSKRVRACSLAIVY